MRSAHQSLLVRSRVRRIRLLFRSASDVSVSSSAWKQRDSQSTVVWWWTAYQFVPSKYRLSKTAESHRKAVSECAGSFLEFIKNARDTLPVLSNCRIYCSRSLLASMRPVSRGETQAFIARQAIDRVKSDSFTQELNQRRKKAFGFLS